jgi:hypothetical protein
MVNMWSEVRITCLLSCTRLGNCRLFCTYLEKNHIADAAQTGQEFRGYMNANLQLLCYVRIRRLRMRRHILWQICQAQVGPG